MRLRELKDVISDDASVSLQVKNSNELPVLYTTWKECKNELKEEAWDMEVNLTSYVGIQIVFTL